MTRRAITVVAALALAACAQEAAKPPPPEPAGPPNVVLLVGDGLGVGAWSLARIVAELHGEELAMDSPEDSGFLDPRAADNFVTDSAAAATAWSTGRRSPRGGGLPDAGTPNLFERLKAAGRACGFVTTARVTHDTVSPFYMPPAPLRSEDEIAEQLIEHLPDIAVGGGARQFLPSPAGRRRDGRDLLAEAEARGAAVVRKIDGELPADRPVLAVLAPSHLPHELDRTPDDPALEDLAVAGLRRLEATGKPWFLLVEGARIDHAAQDHDGAGLVHDTLELDRTIRAVLEAVDPARTLVIAAADHETASPALVEVAHPESLDVVNASVEAMEERIFRGESWPGAPESLLDRALPVLDEAAAHTGLYAAEVDRLLRASSASERRTALGDALSRRFGIVFLDARDPLASGAASGHTGNLVPVRAWGVRAGQVRGIHTHDELGRWIAEVMELPRTKRTAASADTSRAEAAPRPDPD